LCGDSVANTDPNRIDVAEHERQPNGDSNGDGSGYANTGADWICSCRCTRDRRPLARRKWKLSRTSAPPDLDGCRVRAGLRAQRALKHTRSR